MFGSGPARAPLGERRYARVAVERAIEGPGAGEGLTYECTGQTLEVGERVEVPLGRGDRATPGVVVRLGGSELLDGFDPERVKAVLRSHGGGLPGGLVELAQWIAQYYVCPLGTTLSTMTPAAVKKRVGARTRKVLVRNGSEVEAKLSAKARDAWKRISGLDDASFPIGARDLAARLELASVREVNALVRAGMLREVDEAHVRVFGNAASDLDTSSLAPGAAPEPTRMQRSVIDGIGATLGSFAAHVLLGVTGSGKTEVYLRLIRRVLDRGESAIVLVPEIALTPQASARFRGRFAGEGVAVLHSGLSASERHAEWERVRRGGARVVVGARSAVFAPCERVGLIVVDEEHDTSYKQDQAPRYHARDVAIKRAQLVGCPVVMGSATPSLESFANGISGRAGWSLWRLSERVGGGAMPRVRVVDMAREREALRAASTGGYESSIGPTLRGALARTLREGGQAILLLNRRGFATYLACRGKDCGWHLACDHCDARMVVHRDRTLPRGSMVKCHHCLAEKLVPTRCPVCGGGLMAQGAGTQRVEDELSSWLGPEFGLEVGREVLRLDSDAMRGAADYFAALDAFARGRARVLLGTQMIAKGLDFPGVRLVGVLSADTSLLMPDFRAVERTFQLVAQVAGRAGRASAGGEVIVQTYEPELPAIRHAARHDYEGFAREELAARRDAGLPPSTRMARIVVRDEDRERAWSRAREIHARLEGAGARGLTLTGPMDCVLARVADHFRVGIEIVAPSAASLVGTLSSLRSEAGVSSDAHTAIDVDPLSLL
ncbi:MAG: primosomal protein N' [Phycisphaerales bacterium]|jgi:primosomal protein N' (replication factor Y)|nr:primosomal protein N' [Phycisphaerales bacterium]